MSRQTLACVGNSLMSHSGLESAAECDVNQDLPCIPRNVSRSERFNFSFLLRKQRIPCAGFVEEHEPIIWKNAINYPGYYRSGFDGCSNFEQTRLDQS
jgi:hypothetical protein